ncbi:PREDICTED: REF/SRPP-like protein At1g67360 [Ipomoea nil]|uniref:REF/SRPP-like protein At1g67360 n=1 Tax=Ipomoea nil TaxID=35883 RepID=UPI000900AA0D|nr:PREDICTED: REF/SRPP-like protein At1g67360 [Ipomoea nil]
MASDKIEMERSEEKLKHLGFVRVVTVNAVVLISNLYEYAKQNSGPLKSTVGTVENAVTTVVRPVYDKFKDVPDDVLVFLDKKVDEATEKFGEHAPPMVKKLVSQAQIVVLKASHVARDLIQEAKVSGPRAAIYHAGTMSKQFGVFQIAVLWYHINLSPALHSIAEIATPTAAHWSEKYNELVKLMNAKGYDIFYYVPLVPVEEISKAYKQVEAAAAAKKDDDITPSSMTESLTE